ncbi:MAG: very short patch repair endonuclease [Rhizobiaceae bacterium]
MDTISKERRSWVMARIRSKDTGPEIQIRRGLHALGFRFRLHSSRFPGKPDLVLPKYRAVVFVHGCYWHGHDCGEAKLPASNQDYWSPKIARTRARDQRHLESVAAAGWRSLTIWECALRGKRRRSVETVVGEAARWITEDRSSAVIKGDSFPETA